jgi:hypothetical protein
MQKKQMTRLTILLTLTIFLLFGQDSNGQTGNDSLEIKFKSYMQAGDSLFSLQYYHSANQQYSLALNIKPADSSATRKLAKSQQSLKSLPKPFEPCGKWYKNKMITYDGCYVGYEFMEGLEYVYDNNDKLIQIKVFKDFRCVGNKPIE